MKTKFVPFRRGFTMLEMSMAFVVLSVVIGVASATFGGFARVQKDNDARRTLLRAAEEVLTAEQLHLTPNIPENISVKLAPIDAPSGSKLHWVEATATDGVRVESLEGVVP